MLGEARDIGLLGTVVSYGMCVRAWLLTYLTLRNGRPDLLLSVFSMILRSDKGRALKPQCKWYHSEAKLSWDTESSYSVPVGKCLGILAFDRVEQLTTASRTFNGRGAGLPPWAHF